MDEKEILVKKNSKEKLCAMYFPPSFQRFQCDGHSKAPKNLAKKSKDFETPQVSKKRFYKDS